MTKRDDIKSLADALREGQGDFMGPGPHTIDIDENGVVFVKDATGRVAMFMSSDTWETFEREIGEAPVNVDLCVTADGRWFWRQVDRA